MAELTDADIRDRVRERYAAAATRGTGCGEGCGEPFGGGLYDAEEASGAPTVALEALACGRPIIATRVGDLPLIIEEGRTGLFFDGAVLGLRDAVARLASLGNSQQSCERAAKRFGWDSVVPRVRETYYAVG